MGKEKSFPEEKRSCGEAAMEDGIRGLKRKRLTEGYMHSVLFVGLDSRLRVAMIKTDMPF